MTEVGLIADDASPSGPVAITVSPFACACRRILAKLIDATLFGVLSLVVGRLLVPDQVSAGGLVPIIGTTIWALGFFVVADTVFVQLLGATPGEYVAGVRVSAIDGTKLTWSARQDRTTDALVDGTLGAVGLLRCLLAGKSAPYDRDWRVEFPPARRAQRLLAGALIVGAMSALALMGAWLVLARALDADTRVAASKVLRYFHVPVKAVWANPVTGLAVALPDGWVVLQTFHRPGSLQAVAEFDCSSPQRANCRVVLGVESAPMAGETMSGEVEAATAAIEARFEDVLDEPGAALLDDRENVTADARLGQIYSAILPELQGDERRLPRYGLAWFTMRRHAWVMSITIPQRDAGTALSGEELGLVMSLVHSSMHGDAR